MKKFTRRSAAVAVVVLGLIGAGVAFAAWTSTGTGDTNTATAGTATGLTVNAGAAVTGLYPTKSVVLNPTVTNGNTYPVKLMTVSVNSVKADATHETAGCTVAVSGASATAPSAAVINALPVIAAGGNSAALPITVSLSASSDNACQGAAFTVNFTATADSSN